MAAPAPTAPIAPQLSANETILGFTVTRVTPMPQFRGTAVELTHVKTGARVFHLHTPDDAENLFSVFFPTPPTDDTGVAHILEHAVLGGSKKFPVKDPFFEMVKSSMATFINAMTASDFTVYPVASNVRQDFYNLSEVYWDAVFYPDLTRSTFQREGHRLEFATPGDKESPLIIKGIVYNEMKGAKSGPDAVAWDLIGKALWPDTVYGRDSGGDPDYIPTLTYENFLAFHKQWYHPSNGRFFLYGDIPTRDHLAFLDEKLGAFEKREITPVLESQPRWKEPRKLRAAYSIDDGETTAEKTYITVSWLIGNSGDARQTLAMHVLSTILLGNQGAPLRKALIDSKLGSDITHSGFQTWAKESNFHVGVKGSEPEKTAAVETLVLGTLKKLAEEGIADGLVQAAFQQLAYSNLEISSGFPVNLLWRVAESWMYAGDPLPMLYAADHLADIKAEYARNPRLFSDLIQTHLLSNTHRFTLTLSPEAGLQARKDAELEQKLALQKASLEESQLSTIAVEQAELDRLMNESNAPEAIATLPQLQVRDLPPKPRHIPTEIEILAGGRITLLHNDVFANSINYLHLHLNLETLPDELWPFLPIYADCVGKMGAAGQDYVVTAARKASYTGGIGFGYDAGRMASDPKKSIRGATFTVRFLDDTAEPALGVLQDLIFSLDLFTPARLKEILIQSRAHHRTRPAQSGLSIALTHASRGLSPEAMLNYRMHGVPATRQVEALAAAASTDALTEKLQQIHAHLIGQSKPTASFTGSAKVHPAVVKTLGEWAGRLNTNEKQDAGSKKQEIVAESTQVPEGLAAPMDASYNAMVLPAPHLTSPDAPLLMVANRLLSMSYVLEEVRFKGTAYGGGTSYNPLGQALSFHSYRDPWIHKTLDTYKNALAWLAAAPWTATDVDRAIIGTAKEGERPIRPAEATGAALSRYLLGETRETRDKRHAALLAATPQETKRALTEVLEKGMATATIAVVSSRDRLEAANAERPGSPLTIEDILPN